MKRWIFFVVLFAGCTATRLTQYRSGWKSCKAADPNLIECNGKEMAQVECFHPGEEACGALAIRYADGERVFLYRPPGFEPTPESEAALEDRLVLRPELASDASKIWYRAAGSGRDNWTVFEPETGISRQVDSFQIFQIREKDPHSMPLWVANLPK